VVVMEEEVVVVEGHAEQEGEGEDARRSLGRVALICCCDDDVDMSSCRSW